MHIIILKLLKKVLQITTVCAGSKLHELSIDLIKNVNVNYTALGI